MSSIVRNECERITLSWSTFLSSLRDQHELFHRGNGLLIFAYLKFNFVEQQECFANHVFSQIINVFRIDVVVGSVRNAMKNELSTA